MKSLDVREIAPRYRHPLIFQMIDELDKGEAFALVDDHDPQPLYYQFLHELPEQFIWKYLAQSTDVWHGSIQRQAAQEAE